MLLKMPNKVAYLITYISYSCVHNNKGTIDENLLEQFILDKVSEYIINNSFSTKFELIDDIIKFWERYGEYNVWEAYCIKDNIWINMKPSNEDILLNIYEMTQSVEMLEESVLNLKENEFKENHILNLKENEFKENHILNLKENKFKENYILNLEENKFKENYILNLEENKFKENYILNLEERILSETLEIINLSQTTCDSSEMSNYSNLIGENIIIDEYIEIDWNAISNQEQEEQEEQEEQKHE